jgi:hypothetical protein
MGTKCYEVLCDEQGIGGDGEYSPALWPANNGHPASDGGRQGTAINHFLG